MSKKEALDLHKKLAGKLRVTPSRNVRSNRDLSLVYTPGVAHVSREIAKKKNARNYTIKKNSVAIVSDGTAVLGLGDIGPEAALPVMEGKAVLFKQFANIDAFPLCLDTKNAEELIETVRRIAPVFGGINLEDIAAPNCFVVEEELQNLGIPVMHDDQHGTATVILAALYNAFKVSKKSFEESTILINGAGAAGTALVHLLLEAKKDRKNLICDSVKNIIICDSKGVIHKGRKDLNPYKKELANITNKENVHGRLDHVLDHVDVFIGLSKGNILNQKMVKQMNKDPIILALSNPTPEIMPDIAKKAGADIVATGRSDFPNQVNNALTFPGIFRGALDAGAKKITAQMKLASSLGLAKTLKKPSKRKILPSVFDPAVVKNIATAVKKNV